MSDGPPAPKNKFYYGSPSQNAWVQDLHWKMSVENEKKFRDPVRLQEGMEEYRKHKLAASRPPPTIASNAVQENLEMTRKRSADRAAQKRSARRAKSSSQKLAERVRRSSRVRDVVKSCMEDDLLSVRTQLQQAIDGREKTNSRLRDMREMIQGMRRAAEEGDAQS